MNKCRTCSKNCVGEYCFQHKSRKQLSSNTTLKKTKWGLTFNNMNRRTIQTSSIDKIKMREFFISIWNKRKIHKCEMCGQGLGNEPLSYMFDHILEKSVYPELKFEEDNIAYLCLLCHDSKTRGFPSESYLQKINETKIKYNLK